MYEIYETKLHLTEDNDRNAEQNKNYLKEKGIFMVNLMGSPGAGKTSLLRLTIDALKNKYRIGVMEADVDSDIDAAAMHELGVDVIQVHSSGLCHMDADMTRQGLEKMNLEDLDVVFLENIGNLVCPAEFDVGAAQKVMILSVPEGHDKPLKYPLMFKVSDCLIINKTDTADIFDFDIDTCRRYAEELHPGITVISLSAKTKEGSEAWIRWLEEKIEEWRNA